MDLLEVRNVSKIYGSGETAVQALQKVYFSVPKGEYVAIGRALITRPSLILADEPTGGVKLVVQQSQKNNVDIFLMVNTDFLDD